MQDLLFQLHLLLQPVALGLLCKCHALSGRTQGVLVCMDNRATEQEHMPAAVLEGADSLTMLLIMVCSFSCSNLRPFSLLAGPLAADTVVSAIALGYS